LKARGLIDCIPWKALDVKGLRAKIISMLDNLDHYRLPMQGFSLDGIDVIQERLQKFREGQE